MNTGQTTEGNSSELQLVSFTLAGEEYGIDILSVQEINRMLAITRVPNAPPFLEGLVNLRGKVIPVISLRKKFGLAEKEPDRDTRIIVVTVAGRTTGIVVDGVSEVRRLSAEMVQPSPDVVASAAEEYISGIGKIGERLLILLDLQRLLGSDVLELGEMTQS